MPMYTVSDDGTSGDNGRETPTSKKDPSAERGQPYRSPWQRDYDRILHSSSFRRLQGKSQLIPGLEGDFFRNRLTHSLEVAQVGKSIVDRLNSHESFFKSPDHALKPAIVEAAALAHDIGHPPFGHNGEAALHSRMTAAGGFEGNAQSLRIVSRLEKRQCRPFYIGGSWETPFSAGKDLRVGLNLTFRTLAAIIKYDTKIPHDLTKNKKDTNIMKGYYTTEDPLVSTIKHNVIGNFSTSMKTIECQIMDIADDIAYSTFDMEDAFKAGFVTPFDFLGADGSLVEDVAQKVQREMIKLDYDNRESETSIDDVYNCMYDTFAPLFEIPSEKATARPDFNNPQSLIPLFTIGHRSAMNVARNGYIRSSLISDLIAEYIFGVEVKEPNEDKPVLTKIQLNTKTRKKVEMFKHMTYNLVTSSPRFRISEYRDKEIVNPIFDVIVGKAGHSRYELLPDDVRRICFACDSREHAKRVVCDFIAGMTDRYAVEFYGRLTSETPQSMYKPI